LMELEGNSVRQYAVPKRILLSAHDFEGTPPLEQIDIEKHAVVDAMKVAAKAQTITDSVRLLWVAKRSKKIVAVPMGDVGLPARILALREGSALAYAPVGEATAPGQISLREMLHLYRAHQLGSKTRVYGVIGNPVGHSLSPLMHNTGFIVAAKDAVYLPFLVHDLEDFLRVIHPLGIRGFSVTIPHKQTIMKYLNRCSPLAEKIGAVNTVMVRANGELCGANTDMEGVLWALRHKLSFQGTRVLIFGAGGAARAAAFGLANYQVNVAICARREQLASELARDVNGEALPRRALLTESFDAIVNATPVGMCPHTGVSPLTERELNCRLVMDMIYRPQQTELLKIAERIGIATVSGAEMFLAQGFAQWDVWADRPHRKGERPDDAMRKAVMDALNAEESRAAGNNRSRA
jgi:3-dehydroquinate dehydratase/shikimate dehydrogenase